MDSARKLQFWDLLLECGFKEIEVAFPSASQTDFNFVRQLIDEQRIPEDVTIQVLTQARDPLILRTFEALRGARQATVHLYNATAPLFRELVFGMDKAASDRPGDPRHPTYPPAVRTTAGDPLAIRILTRDLLLYRTRVCP